MEAAEFFQERDQAMEAAEEVITGKKVYEAQIRKELSEDLTNPGKRKLPMEAAEFFQERDEAMEAAEEVINRKKAYEAQVRQLEKKVKTYLESLEGNVNARELQEIRDVYRRKFGFLKNYE